MTYRDDLEALKARLAETERENDALRKENETLRRGIAPRVIDVGKVLGVPTRLRIERTFHGELPSSAHAEIARKVRGALGVRGSAISLGKTLVVRTRSQREARIFELRVEAKDGRTTVTVDEKLGQLAGGLLGGVGGGLGMGGLGAIVPWLVLGFGPSAALVAVPAWILASVGFARVLYGMLVERREASHVALVQKLGETIQAALDAERAPASARVRVADGATTLPIDETEADAPAATSTTKARG